MSDDRAKQRNFDGRTDAEKENKQGLESAPSTSGVGNGPLDEPVPGFVRGLHGGCEKVIAGRNNTWIILGRDRPHHYMSGYGGKSNTQAGAIDIVIGRMGNLEGTPQNAIDVHPHFHTDSARIYMSQKADIDDYFKLVGDSQHKGISGIGIKADGVRIIGRRGVKIVSGPGKDLSSGPELDSQGRPIESKEGIELIGANDVEANPLEPLVKAYALAETLQIMVDEISALRGIVDSLSSIQTQVNNALSTHVHTPPNAGGTSPQLVGIVPSQEAKKMDEVANKLYKQGVKWGLFSSNRLSTIGDKWFGSQFNKTN